MNSENLRQPYRAIVTWPDGTQEEFNVIGQLVLPEGSPTPIAITIQDDECSYPMTRSGIERALRGK